MKIYQVELSIRARKFLDKLKSPEIDKIYAAIELLSVNPMPPRATKLAGRDLYRVRVIDYRILYTVENNKLIIQVIDIGHRRDIYKK